MPDEMKRMKQEKRFFRTQCRVVIFGKISKTRGVFFCWSNREGDFFPVWPESENSSKTFWAENSERNKKICFQRFLRPNRGKPENRDVGFQERIKI